MFKNRFRLLEAAYKRSGNTAEFKQFCRENQWWLDDYALFMSLKEHFGSREWLAWDEDIRIRKPEAVEHYKKLLKERLGFWRFCQFQFYSQWGRLKSYANEKGIHIIGDIPIYVAMDSSDVWVNTGLFQLDERRRPTCVSGVPPDAFSDTGQLWGNPLYNWGSMEKDGFAWWRSRIKHCGEIYDAVRIDHFIGISRYYTIPAGSDTAICGEWKEGPGRKLTEAIDEAIGSKSIIAEDLGVLHPSVVQLLRETGYPGMKVMLFGFDGNPDNEHLPGNFKDNMIAYGGTHDNATIAGTFKDCSYEEIGYVMNYLQISTREQIPWAMLEALYASPARAAIFQMQDILQLDNRARMNTPSTLGGNWCWRMEKGQFTPEHREKLRTLAERYNR
jgi:4-alpha-glucanotransferase